MNYDYLSLYPDELKKVMEELKVPAFRAAQLYRWMHVSMETDPEKMTNIPLSLKLLLSERGYFTSLRLIDRQVSAVDGTEKYLFALPDDNLVESVLMRYHYGNSVCISSQVGCRMGCTFCASTLNGWERNLTPAEMLLQIYSISRITGERVSHVVVMGTGEPMDNLDNLIRFIRILTSGEGMNLSRRNITVSTCGLTKEMRKFADEDLGVTLALSLHAATDEKRRRIMPVARKYTVREVVDAAGYYSRKTGRQVTFEYALIAGVNDTPKDAEDLAGLAAPIGAHVNLIPVNPVTERGYREPDRRSAAAFKDNLEKRRINVTIRRELGRDIDGACGQLRRRHLSGKEQGNQ